MSLFSACFPCVGNTSSNYTPVKSSDNSDRDTSSNIEKGSNCGKTVAKGLGYTAATLTVLPLVAIGIYKLYDSNNSGSYRPVKINYYPKTTFSEIGPNKPSEASKVEPKTSSKAYKALKVIAYTTSVLTVLPFIGLLVYNSANTAIKTKRVASCTKSLNQTYDDVKEQKEKTNPEASKITTESSEESKEAELEKVKREAARSKLNAEIESSPEFQEAKIRLVNAEAKRDAAKTQQKEAYQALKVAAELFFAVATLGISLGIHDVVSSGAAYDVPDQLDNPNTTTPKEWYA